MIGLAVGTTQIRARASTPVSANYSVPVHIQVNATATTCSNNTFSDTTGPTVTIDGTLTIPTGLGAQLTFENNDNNPGKHTYTVAGTLDFTVTPANGSISIPKQPVDGGSGGNPWIWLGLTDPSGNLLSLSDGAGNAIANPVMIGRCVQGMQLASIDAWFADPSLVQALFSTTSCTNDGSNLVIDMSGNHGGVNGAIVFDNNQNKFSWLDAPPGAHQSDPKKGEVSAGFTLTGPTFPQTVFKGSPTGPGGNPLVVVEIFNTDGNPSGNYDSQHNPVPNNLGDVLGPTSIGRCRSL